MSPALSGLLYCAERISIPDKDIILSNTAMSILAGLLVLLTVIIYTSATSPRWICFGKETGSCYLKVSITT